MHWSLAYTPHTSKNCSTVAWKFGTDDSTWMMPEWASIATEWVWMSDDIFGGFCRPILRGTTTLRLRPPTYRVRCQW
jgi:hypothetical protein